MHVFVPIYKQKLYILKIKLFLGIHTILWNKKSAVKCFKCYSEKRLHNFVNRLEIGTTIIHVFESYAMIQVPKNALYIKCLL